MEKLNFVLIVTFLLINISTVIAEEPAKQVEEPKKESLLTDEVKKAIDKGLKWLAEAQDEDGLWEAANSTGITGIVLVAFVSNGNSPEEGTYKETVKKGMEFLLDSQDEETGYIGNSMYHHGFATLALAEISNKYKNDELRKALEKAVKLILKSQNGTGGWRYSPSSQDMDSCVTSCQIRALYAAKKAGIDIPEKKMKRAAKAIKKCAIGGGGFGYAGPDGAGIARTGAGISSLIACGEEKSEEVKDSLEWLSDQGFDAGWWSYGLYYSALAMHLGGDKHWKAWYPDIQEQLLDAQKKDGSFVMMGNPQNVIMDTAFSIIALSFQKNLLPGFKK